MNVGHMAPPPLVHQLLVDLYNQHQKNNKYKKKGEKESLYDWIKMACLP